MRGLRPLTVGGLLAGGLLLAGCDNSEAPAKPIENGSAVDAGRAGTGQDQAASRDPAEIYAQHCVHCHGTGMAGAPMVGPEHRLIWSEEIEEEGFPTLVKIAIEGQNGMPPRGTCFDCSDEEIEATVLYMLKQSGAK